MADELTPQQREATLGRELRREREQAAAAKAEAEQAKAELAQVRQGQAPAGEEPSASEALRAAAAAAEMSPQRFVELSGKTSLAAWEAGRAAEGGE